MILLLIPYHSNHFCCYGRTSGTFAHGLLLPITISHPQCHCIIIGNILSTLEHRPQFKPHVSCMPLLHSANMSR